MQCVIFCITIRDSWLTEHVEITKYIVNLDNQTNVVVGVKLRDKKKKKS